MTHLNLYNMKKTFFFALLFISYTSFSQLFWTESFGTSACTSVLANGCNASGNGVWLTSNTGTNQSNSNNWFVSAKEAGMGVGACGNGCGTIGTLTNRTLHVGSTFISVDPGAAYLAGVSSNTDKRADSPLINCTGRNNINLAFNYLSAGIPGVDYFSVYYFDGVTWSLLSTPGPSPTGTCSPQGLWTAYSTALPASANNNAGIKIGFRWINTDPTGADPSVAIDDITLTAAVTPTATVSFTLPSPVCEANTINAAFTSTASLTTFTWSATSPNVVFTPPNSGTTTISFTAPGTYTVSLTACQGTTNCATASSSIQVLPTPTINVTASPTVVCTPGGSSTLTATGGPSASSYSWTASAGPAIPNGSMTVVSPTATTNYTVLTSIPGCTTGVTFNVPVSPAPNLTVTPNSSICSGQNIALSVSGAATYTWSPAGTLSSANGSTVTASPITTTTYTVTGNNGVCSNIAAVTVTVNASASVTVAPTNTTICLGQGASLTASGGSTYTWTASSGTNPPGTANVVVTPTTNTTYTVLTGSGSCTASAVTSVSVAPALSITATPNATTICGGGSVSITASGATSYTWSPAAGLSSTSGAVVTATPATSTNYVITGSNGVCTVTTSANVTVTIVNTTVTASAANYCIGATPVSLTASGATTYSWAPATGLSSTSGAVVTATPVVTTVYTVTGTSGLCSSVKTVTVTVPPTSTITITSTGTLICAGGAGTTLTASGANTYTWLPGGLTTASINANPATTTTYSVGGQTALGCVALPATITVSVAPALTPTVTASSATVCLSNTVSLAVVPAGPGISYTWTPAAAIQGANNTAAVIAKPTTTATVNYTVTVSNGLCISTATISVQPFLCVPPTADIQTITNDSICTNGCVTFTAVTTGSQPMTYQWVFPGGTPPTSNVANPQVCYLVKGNYPVTLIVVNAYGSDTTLKTNYINVADTPRVFNATGDTTLKIGQTTTIHANGTALNYYWYPNVNGSIACPTCSNTVVQPTVTTKYYVEASNSPYCKRRDSVIVKVDFTCGDFFVPNAFSPNGDGLNDMVNVHGFCIGTYNLQIFNRWGEKVFETSSFSDSWDGTFRGKSLDTGVFVYRADGITIDGKPFNIKGNITLIK